MLGCLLLLAGTGYARKGPCSAEKGKLAEKEADTLRDWDSLQKSYAQYNNCDDGATAEGYSQSVARILVDHWETLPRLADIAKDASAFKAFVLKHVDASLNKSDIETIAANAKTRCPNGLGHLCNDLKKQAR
jgi:hypothetical protein